MKEDTTGQSENTSFGQSVAIFLHDVAYTLIALIVLLVLVFRVVVVSGTSMNMTLLDGDYLLLLSNTLYLNPKQGDIVVISMESFHNGDAIVKRIIATEGQTVDIDFEKGIVYVDGVALEEPYIHTPTTTSGGTQFPLTVEEGCVFVLGDNRGISQDSRYPSIGQIDTREILGKAIFLIFPGTNYDQKDREFSRIGVFE